MYKCISIYTTARSEYHVLDRTDIVTSSRYHALSIKTHINRKWNSSTPQDTQTHSNNSYKTKTHLMMQLNFTLTRSQSYITPYLLGLSLDVREGSSWKSRRTCSVRPWVKLDQEQAGGTCRELKAWLPSLNLLCSLPSPLRFCCSIPMEPTLVP